MGLIFLCGLPGSGKSSVGKAVAEAFVLPFVDLDEEIEKECGRSIGEIFEQEGEAFFRVLETQALTRACAQRSAVVALGAGVLENDENLASVLECGQLVYLRVPVDAIANRISSWESRPLFSECATKVQITVKLKQLLSKREARYLRADYIVDVSDNESAEQTASRVTALLA
ncbi:shikimate kinase [bacterium]|nr:shikimate kinase [bacterium]MBU1636834.1 shikimate kinase [bacterium]MBU1921171.1 shikimate kinase [bacterium]